MTPAHSSAGFGRLLAGRAVAMMPVEMRSPRALALLLLLSSALPTLADDRLAPRERARLLESLGPSRALRRLVSYEFTRPTAGRAWPAAQPRWPRLPRAWQNRRWRSSPSAPPRLPLLRDAVHRRRDRLIAATARQDAAGHPLIGFLVLEGALPRVDELSFEHAANGTLELEVIFRPEGTWKLKRRASRFYDGVKAFLGVRLVDSQAGPRIASRVLQ
jgi:hypothetical protein